MKNLSIIYLLSALTDSDDVAECSHQYQTTDELSKDYVLVCKIVHHLIKRDNVLIVLGTPNRKENESNQDFAKRQQQERVLAVNPNYSAD